MRNVRHGASLSKISGTGSLTQAGPATTTLTGGTTYTGPTTVSKGTLALTGGTLKHSSGVALTAADATLDLRRAADPALKRLTTVKGATLLLPGTGREGRESRESREGDVVVVGGVEFTVRSRSGGAITLVSTGRDGTPEAGPTPTASPTAAAPAPPTNRPLGEQQAQRPGDLAADTATATGSTAVWAAALAAAAALCAGALALRARRRRPAPAGARATHRGPARRRRRRGAA